MNTFRETGPFLTNEEWERLYRSSPYEYDLTSEPEQIIIKVERIVYELTQNQ